MTAFEWAEAFFSFITRHAYGLALLCGIGVAAWALWRMHVGKNHIDLADLVCTDGYLNDKKFRKTGAWLVSTWGFGVLVLSGKMEEWYFVGYMAAWVLDAGYDRYIRAKENIALGENAATIRGDKVPAAPEVPPDSNPK